MVLILFNCWKISFILICFSKSDNMKLLIQLLNLVWKENQSVDFNILIRTRMFRFSGHKAYIFEYKFLITTSNHNTQLWGNNAKVTAENACSKKNWQNVSQGHGCTNSRQSKKGHKSRMEKWSSPKSKFDFFMVLDLMHKTQTICIRGT